MKNTFARFLVFAGLMIGLVGFVQAKRVSSYNVNIPFDFIVGEKSFKAGDYSVTFGVFQSNPANFIIRSADGKQSAIVTYGIPKASDQRSKSFYLVFKVSGEQYYLAEANSPGRSFELYDSRPATARKRIQVAVAK